MPRCKINISLSYWWQAYRRSLKFWRFIILDKIIFHEHYILYVWIWDISWFQSSSTTFMWIWWNFICYSRWLLLQIVTKNNEKLFFLHFIGVKNSKTNLDLTLWWCIWIRTNSNCCHAYLLLSKQHEKNNWSCWAWYSTYKTLKLRLNLRLIHQNNTFRSSLSE